MSEIRVEFELFAKEYNLTLTSSGYYVDRVVRKMWEAWQASREALKVKLPDCAHDPARDAIELVMLELDKLGIIYE